MTASRALAFSLVAMACAPAVARPADDAASHVADEENISNELAQLAAAWSRGDAEGAASYYAEDGLRVDPMGEVEHGRAKIAAAYSRVLHGGFAGAKFTVARGSIRWITSDVALWQGGLSIAPPGDAPVKKAYLVHLVKRVNGRWLILEAHPKLLLPVP